MNWFRRIFKKSDAQIKYESENDKKKVSHKEINNLSNEIAFKEESKNEYEKFLYRVLQNRPNTNTSSDYETFESICMFVGYMVSFYRFLITQREVAAIYAGVNLEHELNRLESVFIDFSDQIVINIEKLDLAIPDFILAVLGSEDQLVQQIGKKYSANHVVFYQIGAIWGELTTRDPSIKRIGEEIQLKEKFAQVGLLSEWPAIEGVINAIHNGNTSEKEIKLGGMMVLFALANAIDHKRRDALYL